MAGANRTRWNTHLYASEINCILHWHALNGTTEQRCSRGNVRCVIDGIVIVHRLVGRLNAQSLTRQLHAAAILGLAK